NVRLSMALDTIVGEVHSNYAAQIIDGEQNSQRAGDQENEVEEVSVIVHHNHGMAAHRGKRPALIAPQRYRLRERQRQPHQAQPAIPPFALGRDEEL
ncbi:hypothetical protein DC030_15160, partial [Enterococcus faecalis]